jgi:hypothetical protein
MPSVSADRRSESSITGPMGETGEDDMFESFELVAQGGIDARVAVTKEVDPPRADPVQVTPAVEVIQPDTSGAGHRNQRQRFARGCMLLHLGARVPDSRQAALEQIAIAH